MSQAIVPRRRVMVIGLDAATFDVIRPLTQAGKLPALRRMMDEGSCGQVQSTFPTVSPVAWSSVMTGKHPAHHGVLSFLQYPPQGHRYHRPFVSFTSLRSRTFFQTLSEAGLKVIVVGIPLTYPPPAVNGFLISGFMTPAKAADCTFPPHLHTELISHLGRYTVDVHLTQFQPGDELTFLTQLYDAEELRLRAFEYLLDRCDWDFAMVVFMSPDQLQHLFWRHMDSSHPAHDPHTSPKYAEVIRQCYERMDCIVGRLQQRLHPQDVLMVMSDHGAGPETSRFHVNVFLERVRLLRTHFIKRGDELTLKKRQFLDGIPLPTVRALFSGLYLMEELWRGLRGRRRGPALGSINWKRTKAYYATESELGIWVNLKGREPLGIVEPGHEYEAVRDELLRALEALRHPKTGEKVVKWANRREKVIDGPYAESAPDVLFEMNDPACSPTEVLGEELFSPSTRISASHRPEGILVLHGSSIRKGQTLTGARLIDIAPTILYLLGQPIPTDMDGQVLTEAIEENELASRPVCIGAPMPSPEPAPGEAAYTPDEEEQIAARLRGLGYIE